MNALRRRMYSRTLIVRSAISGVMWAGVAMLMMVIVLGRYESVRDLAWSLRGGILVAPFIGIAAGLCSAIFEGVGFVGRAVVSLGTLYVAACLFVLGARFTAFAAGDIEAGAVSRAVALTVGLHGLQNESATRAIRLRFPEPADLNGLSIRYFLKGPFGGFGSSVRTRPDVREYALEIQRGGQQATSIKAIIFCPGYRTVLLTESALAGRPTGAVSITLEPLGWVQLSGRLISVPTGRSLTIEAVYLAYWGHTFFGIYDGPVESFTVATSKVAADGGFALKVPDLARDPVVTSFGDEQMRGVLRLVAREAETGNIPYVLEAIQQAGQAATFPIAREYPRDLQLVAIRR